MLPGPHRPLPAARALRAGAPLRSAFKTPSPSVRCPLLIGCAATTNHRLPLGWPGAPRSGRSAGENKGNQPGNWEAGLEHPSGRGWLGGLLPLAEPGRKTTCKKLREVVGCRCMSFLLSPPLCGELKWTELPFWKKKRDQRSCLCSVIFGFLVFLLSI